ncbi:MAG: hypothetical protein ACKVWV_13835 [Planctomycetota bacterium]
MSVPVRRRFAGLVFVSCFTWCASLVAWTGRASAQCSTCPPPPPVISDEMITAAATLANGGAYPADVDFAIDDSAKSDFLAEFDEGLLWFDDTITIYTGNIARLFEVTDFSSSFFEGLLSGILHHEFGHKCASDRGGTNNADNEFYACHHIAVFADTATFACEQAEELEFEIDDLMKQSPLPIDEINALRDKVEGLCRVNEASREMMNRPEGAMAAKECSCGSTPYAPPTECPELTILPPPGGCSSDYPEDPRTGEPQVVPECPICP